MTRKNGPRSGVFVVIDGLDGIGKGEIERALIEYEQKLGKAVFDSVAFSKAHRKGLPELADFWQPPETYYDTIVTAEPTYAGIGHTIRNELICTNGRPYDSSAQIQAYSLDRLVQMNRVVIPALECGLTVIQSRCLAATYCYQSLQAQKEGRSVGSVRSYILSQPGNKVQLAHAPDLLIIPTIDSVERVMERIAARKDSRKDDKAIFDTLQFQSNLKPLYDGKDLRQLFESHGTKVVYLNASISVDNSRKEAVDIYRSFLAEHKS